MERKWGFNYNESGGVFVYRAENGCCFKVTFQDGLEVASVFTGYTKSGMNPVLAEYRSNG